MKRKIALVSLFWLLSLIGSAQKSGGEIIAGPMPGHTELRTANIWVQFDAAVTKASVLYREKTAKVDKMKEVKMTLAGGEFNTAATTLTGLEPGRSYQYYIRAGAAKKVVATGEVATQSLWSFRTPPPDFAFLTGSCAYFNQLEYDRPGKPYGGDSSIFKPMAKEKAAFMLWLGDNWYTREADFFSDWGLHYRASHDRSLPILQPFLKAMPQYAIWDDHDYGPNDADKSYELKASARAVFMQYWANPSYGMNNEGIYTKFTWNDVDVFMLDDRWNRSADEMPDSINGQPNKEKKMFGDAQMEWLKSALVVSNGNRGINFRIIATGSQVLNPLSPYDCFRHYPAEYNELMQFIDDQKIKGLVFLTGDRHHSEIIKRERSGAYALYDVTASSLTAGIAKTSGVEATSPYRVLPEIDVNNYSRFSFSGPLRDRKMTVEFLGVKGEKLGEWSVTAKELGN